MDDDAFLPRLQTDLIAIQSVALAGGPDLDRPVPTCPNWTVTDLLTHLWGVQSWAREIVRTRERAMVPVPHDDPTHAIADFVDGISNFLVAMRSVVADEDCWTFGPPPRKSGFWVRRQAHEHAVHRVDLESAFGTIPTFTPDFAADGVHEVVTMFYPRQLRSGRIEPVDGAIALHATDTGDTWQLGDGDPVATVHAAAGDLYLGLWKRLDLLENSQLDGDRAAAEHLLGRAITP